MPPCLPSMYTDLLVGNLTMTNSIPPPVPQCYWRAASSRCGTPSRASHSGPNYCQLLLCLPIACHVLPLMTKPCSPYYFSIMQLCRLGPVTLTRLPRSIAQERGELHFISKQI